MMQQQNGHAQPVPEDHVSDHLSEIPESNISNGTLPPLSHSFARSKRRVRPSSAGQESATLTSSFQASVVPHLPPIISPPHSRRPMPKLPTSDEFPPPITPPPTAGSELVPPEENLVPRSPTAPSFPQPPSFADIGVMAGGQNRDRRTSEGIT